MIEKSQNQVNEAAEVVLGQHSSANIISPTLAKQNFRQKRTRKKAKAIPTFTQPGHQVLHITMAEMSVGERYEVSFGKGEKGRKAAEVYEENLRKVKNYVLAKNAHSWSFGTCVSKLHTEWVVSLRKEDGRASKQMRKPRQRRKAVSTTQADLFANDRKKTVVIPVKIIPTPQNGQHSSMKEVLADAFLTYTEKTPSTEDSNESSTAPLSNN